MSSNEWSFEKNSFDIIRLISALFIILGHIATHLQYQPPNLIMTIQQRWIGLFTLFVMTGFFIPSSIERSKNAKTYFAKRVSRIYPALLAAFVVSLVAVLTFGVHIQKIKVSMGTLVTWIISQVTVFQFYTPSELTLYGVGNPNGSLWTISMELQVYVLLYLIYGWLKRQKISTWAFLIGGGYMINILFSFTKDFLSEFIFKLINVTFLPYLYIYLIGVFVYVHRDKIIPTLKKGFWLIVALYVVWCIINMHIGFSLGHYANIISGSFVCVLTISAGYYFGNHRLQYDFSYSLYLYHMIIINVLAILGITGTWYSMVIVYLFTGVLSALSVFFVEGRGKKAIEKMILKN